jgi:hypothetical protein
MTDGILYSSNGSVVFEIGANNTNTKVSGNLTVKSIVANNSIGNAGEVLTSNGSAVYWTPASPLVFTTNGYSRTVTGYKESTTTYPVRTTSFSGGLLEFVLASFTPTLTATAAPSATLNWDVPVSSFTVTVDNPFDFPSQWISNVYSLAAVTGSISSLSTFSAGAKSMTPAGGVDWVQTFTVAGSAYIYSSSNTITGGTSTSTIQFVASDSGSSSVFANTATLTVNWRTPTLSCSVTALSGNTFLETYTSTTYTVSITNITDPANYLTSVTPTGGTVNNSNTSGTFTFTTPVHKNNTSTTRKVDVLTTFTRPVAVQGTAYSADLSSNASVSATFTYPSFWIFTSSTSSPPSRADIIDGTGFESAATVLGNQVKTYAAYVNNADASPKAFWLGVRTSASQPTSFKTGASPSLLSDVSYTSSSVNLEPDSPPSGYIAESYSLYGITLQPGTTYVSIS